MKSLAGILLSLLLLCYAGCGTFDLSQISPLWPSFTLPSGIVAVAHDNSRFPAVSHPLANARAGTVVDGLAGLDGCWGWYETSIDDATARCEQGDAAWFMLIDLDTGRVTHQFYLRSSDSVCSWPLGGYELLQTYQTTIVLKEDNTGFTERVITGTFAVKPPDQPTPQALLNYLSVPYFNLVAQLSSLNAVPLQFLATLDADSLKTELSSGLLPADSSGGESTSQLWVRMQCPD